MPRGRPLLPETGRVTPLAPGGAGRSRSPCSSAPTPQAWAPCCSRPRRPRSPRSGPPQPSRVAALALAPPRHWLVLVPPSSSSAWPPTSPAAGPSTSASGSALANTAEAVVAALVLTDGLTRPRQSERPRRTSSACWSPPPPGATVIGLIAGAVVDLADPASSCRRLRTTAAHTPPASSPCCRRPRSCGQTRRRWSRELVAQVAVLAALTALIFWPTGTLIIALPPLVALAWAAARLGHPGADPGARRLRGRRLAAHRRGRGPFAAARRRTRTRWPPAPRRSCTCCARRSSRCRWRSRPCSRRPCSTGCGPTSCSSAATSPSRCRHGLPRCGGGAGRPRTRTRTASTCGSSTSTTRPSDPRRRPRPALDTSLLELIELDHDFARRSRRRWPASATAGRRSAH